jgi:TetR/AcrR family transcriptional regulator, transcriptional repressor for nem operon
MARPIKDPDKKPSRELLLEAATDLIRTKGYTSTTVDDLCGRAGVSKGTFFHHFSSKEDLGVAAAKRWSEITSEFFRSAPYHKKQDPLNRFLGYIRFRKEILRGELPEFTCLVGTMVQEIYSSHPEINEACFQSIFHHAEVLESDISVAKKLYCPKAKWTVKSLALHTQAVLQGAFILAKSCGDAKVAAESIDHLENYIHLLFNNKK